MGGLVGAVAGGAAGHALGEALDPTVESAYWRTAYTTRPYFREDRAFEDLEPAFRQGWEQALFAEAGRRFEDVENDLEQTWPHARGTSPVDWDEARNAARDSWDRARDRAAKFAVIPRGLLGNEP